MGAMGPREFEQYQARMSQELESLKTFFELTAAPPEDDEASSLPPDVRLEMQIKIDLSLAETAALDPQGFASAMADVREAFDQAYAGADNRNDPDRLLPLPILGLEALARSTANAA
jgi:hypothetical protein